MPRKTGCLTPQLSTITQTFAPFLYLQKNLYFFSFAHLPVAGPGLVQTDYPWPLGSLTETQ